MKNQRSQLVQLVNLGFQQVLEKEILYVFLKDSSFRPPPTPTILLVEEVIKNHQSRPNCIDIGDTRYHIIGEEILDPSKTYEEKHIFFGNGFVLFPGRRVGKKKVPSYFLIPPISFPELEKEKIRLGIKDIISISPSTDTDEYLREFYDFSKDPDCATIMVGYDSA